jgi:hypothetical protein
MSQYEELIKEYENLIPLEQALNGVPAQLVDRVPGPGKWTIRQLAAHIADSETVGATRLRWVVAQPGSTLKAYDQDAWALHLGYTSLDPQQALELVRSVRRWTASMLRTLPDSAWTQTAIHEERGELTLLDLVKGYIKHTESHAHQIATIRSHAVAA